MSAASVIKNLRQRQSNTWIDKEAQRAKKLEFVRSGQVTSPESYAVSGVRAVRVALAGGGTISAIDPSNAQNIPGQTVTALTSSDGQSALIGRSGNKY